MCSSKLKTLFNYIKLNIVITQWFEHIKARSQFGTKKFHIQDIFQDLIISDNAQPLLEYHNMLQQTAGLLQQTSYIDN